MFIMCTNVFILFLRRTVDIMDKFNLFGIQRIVKVNSGKNLRLSDSTQVCQIHIFICIYNI